MAKGSAKKPKDSKCRGSAAPLEGRDWIRIGGKKWLREVAEKQGKFIPLEYRDKSGSEFDKERAAREAEAQEAKHMALPEIEPEENLEEEIPDAETPFETETEVAIGQE